MMQKTLTTDRTNKKTADPEPLAELWSTIVERLPDEYFPKKLAGTRLLTVADGAATIAFRD